jgi:plastocyanin domain-containing protein
MDPGQLAVTVAGLALVAAVNMFFFAPRRGAAATLAAGAPQEIRIRVRDGYDPSSIEVLAGRPVRLVFHREEVEGCSDSVLLPEWNIVRKLPARADTVVEFIPERRGAYEFTCGMHMLRGKILVR